jgi:two-component system response regulator AtoC
VAARQFREDLFYRLNVVRIHIPPLRERREDIPLLVNYFLKKLAHDQHLDPKSVATNVIRVLEKYHWPGNVRELENVIASAAITANSDFIDVGDLPEHLQRSRRQSSSAATVWSPLPLDEVRSVHIQRVLEMCNGNRVRTAQVLGIGRTSLYRFLKRSDRPSKSVAARGAA